MTKHISDSAHLDGSPPDWADQFCEKDDEGNGISTSSTNSLFVAVDPTTQAILPAVFVESANAMTQIDKNAELSAKQKRDQLSSTYAAAIIKNPEESTIVLAIHYKDMFDKNNPKYMFLTRLLHSVKNFLSDAVNKKILSIYTISSSFYDVFAQSISWCTRNSNFCLLVVLTAIVLATISTLAALAAITVPCAAILSITVLSCSYVSCSYERDRHAISEKIHSCGQYFEIKNKVFLNMVKQHCPKVANTTFRLQLPADKQNSKVRT